MIPFPVEKIESRKNADVLEIEHAKSKRYCVWL